MSTVDYSQTAMVTGAVLVIDDNAIIREALTDVFSVLLDIPVYTAANGHEGLQIFQQQRQSIVLVLLDLNMPVVNGEQTYEKLQQFAPQVKVIISSSLDHAEASRRLGEREMPAFLQKPYDIKSLLTVVQTVLASVQAADEFDPFISQPQNEENGNGNTRNVNPKAFHD